MPNTERREALKEAEEQLLKCADDFSKWLEEEIELYGRVNQVATKQFIDSLWSYVSLYNKKVERWNDERNTRRVN